MLNENNDNVERDGVQRFMYELCNNDNSHMEKKGNSTVYELCRHTHSQTAERLICAYMYVYIYMFTLSLCSVPFA